MEKDVFTNSLENQSNYTFILDSTCIDLVVVTLHVNLSKYITYYSYMDGKMMCIIYFISYSHWSHSTFCK